MELERARSRSSTERGQVEQLLADLGKARTDDHEAKRDATYPAQPLAQQGVDDAVAASLQDRLAALGRAPPAGRRRELRLLDPQRCSHPDERLEADPAAELTVQQAARDQAADR
jgi:DnaK suppressor protein